MPIGFLFVPGLALAAVACSGPGNGPGGGICAPGAFPEDAGSPSADATVTLIVGAEDATHTRVAAAWLDGEHVPLVTGGQGGFMIRPSIDVVAPSPLPEDGAHATCLGVRMIASAPASAPPVLIGGIAARVAGTASTYHVAPLFGLLSSNGGVDRVAILVTFDAHTAAGDGHAQVTVVPDATLSP